MKKFLFLGLIILNNYNYANDKLSSWTQLSAIAPIISTRANIVNQVRNSINNWSNAINLNFLKQNIDLNFHIKFIDDNSIFHMELFLVGAKDYKLSDTYLSQMFIELTSKINDNLNTYKLDINLSSLKGKIIVATNDKKIIKTLNFNDIVQAINSEQVLKEASNILNKIGESHQNMRLGKTKVNNETNLQNINILKNIIKKIGWPTIDKVGKQASHYAWLLVQHADFDLELQKTVLNFLKTLNSQQIDKKEVAYLTDKVLIQNNKKQIYGTQFKIDKDKNIIPEPIEDYKNLDKRRKSLDLENFKSYLSKLYSIYGKKK
ncbi:MAG: hypothetical protein COB02_12910 [Candidatus Cloacimonadota bacterium]|nr:MAG: hypothetical protein COB02_12910 [Candidatus Cloacimonadota bacterium]